MVDTLEIVIVINSRDHGSIVSFGFSESRAKIESQREQGGLLLCFRLLPEL
jgi:hypothetical protein